MGNVLAKALTSPSITSVAILAEGCYYPPMNHKKLRSKTL
ncbi:hypothetical protein X878_0041 [Enterococcus phage VD13]|uniref:Uncharacterized protein n=1 Tax=Enterococcus phage VD13 TaxID=1458851 RepID=X2KRI0_9CAUD|nr:hypothetical protein X878_0041 [Enterococcus phage VD13]AHN83129.1 hypothetical protein X878_0041 [Enterococcus phage VD13]